MMQRQSAATVAVASVRAMSPRTAILLAVAFRVLRALPSTVNLRYPLMNPLVKPSNGTAIPRRLPARSCTLSRRGAGATVRGA